METSQQEHLLTDLDNILVKAHSGKRLLNLIIDRLVFMGFLYLLGFLFYFLGIQLEGLSNINPFVDIILTMALFGIFMGLVETLFKGRSIGKFITGTKAVNLDGTNISSATAFARGLSRAVPFEPFSALGGNGAPEPWHDKWNNTIVIDLKQSTVIKKV